MSSLSKNKSTLAKKISDQFLNGLIVLIPPAITAAVVFWLLDLTEGKLAQYLPVKFPGAGLITILLTIWLTGFISEHTFLQKIIGLGEYLLDKVPVVKFIYSSVKQFSKAVFESNSSFQKVVLIPYHQSLALGFMMTDIPDAVRDKLGEDYVCVFVPWSLNMTSGTNLFVKKSDVIFVDMKPEEALQFMLTAGTITK